MWMVWMAEAPIFRAVRIFKKLNIPFVDLLKIKIGGFAAISWKTNQGATECTFSGSEVVSQVEKTVHKGQYLWIDLHISELNLNISQLS